MAKNKCPFQHGKKDEEFAHGNVDDCNLEVKKSLPQAARFTEPNQNRMSRHRGN
ncbi:MAG: hypothetical protein FWF59_06785 [Turicibacter sp.]|nr:hypothetical protein [Turicibacter sp.]